MFKNNSTLSLSWVTAVLLTLASASAFIAIVPSNNDVRGNHAAATSKVLSTMQIQPSSTFTSASTSTSLFAQKKRRRRSPTSPSSDSNPNPNLQMEDEDEEDVLPDFDLVEDIDLKEQAASAAKLSGGDIDLDDPDVIAAMRVSKGQVAMGSGSTKDLLRSRNRELEDRLVVNVIKEDLPSLAEYTQGNGNGAKASGGSKAAKRMARRTAAIERERENGVEEESAISAFISNVRSKVPFLKKKEENEPKKTAVKLLEEGTWFCIYTLIAWEVYINSPLFSRQGPMAPVVFTDPMTMTFLL